ncbi:hypothetical protein PFICI_01346 [Pestalotiopsis fici W106-1]|uniref:Uncharacterized protein n=1 Tax=Pestalotiopsis fici (strain W106-1 / CGMCC3.15140) TaxID=1229662 RepID=W3XN87_PESFW|nr:uncharacterized protein PFICI_01346 [Pestalotiopsis fici W106-1]ETS87518.1 hypothetical protein PFICI_01346 [Pestalotiopsis fici W106-1]
MDMKNELVVNDDALMEDEAVNDKDDVAAEGQEKPLRGNATRPSSEILVIIVITMAGCIWV